MIRPEFNPADEPNVVADLTYAELIAMITAVGDPDTGDEVMSYYIGIIDCTLSGANVSDLIFWPNEWFNDKEMRHVDLSPAEIANYILSWTGRTLPGAEEVDLPTIPESKRSGPPPVIEL